MLNVSYILGRGGGGIWMYKRERNVDYGQVGKVGGGLRSGSIKLYTYYTRRGEEGPNLHPA